MIKWYRLDNAANLFPSVTNLYNTSVYRVSVLLKEQIDRDILQKSLERVYHRFPMLFVRLHKGVFWNYLEQNTNKFIVEEETEYPCNYITTIKENSYLLRVFYYSNRISVEIFHSLTDGTGAIEFLKSLLYYYLIFSGHTIRLDQKILLADGGVDPCDIEDSFNNYYKKIVAKPKIEQNAYRVSGTQFENYGNNVIHGVVSASKLNAIAKQKGATITSFLTALIIYSIYQTRIQYSNDRRPIVVTVPVNLRHFFPSKTLRNFFDVVNISATVTGETTLDQIILKTTEMLKEKTQKENLLQSLSKNVLLEKFGAVKLVPLFVKNIFVNLGFDIFGENKKTITLSNLGKILLPQDMYEYVQQFEAVLYTTPKSPINCGVCSTNDRLVISFSRVIVETDIIQYFFSYLSEKEGIDVEIYSNDWGIDHDKM
ncbi:MAG TPA: alcohol acetyltransferase [Oscillospiraceae bacterium]|nr:alcohol acetyltransferase [Oscillospiraceae bacterium]